MRATVAEVRINEGHRADGGNGDQRSDQTIFDRCRAVVR
jgi:hypothetical protein